jgi:aspartyl-tRNA(Asn)/glutamyl-tRNA(Gln) amidotransferase subunit A
LFLFFKKEILPLKSNDNAHLNAFINLLPAKPNRLAVGIKANIAVAGLPWHAGIAAYRNGVAERDAECVARLRAGGASILGLLNMDEAAFGGVTDNPFFGRTQNPWRAGYTPGGSSGGAGAAVAAGLCAAALGTDTLGSVRIPVSYCGVIGHVPAPGVISTDGVIPLAPQFDRVGILARDVATIRKMLALLNDVPPAPMTDGPIGVLDVMGLELAPAVAAALAAAALYLLQNGRPVVTVSLAPLDLATIRKAALLVVQCEAARVHADALARNPNGFSPALRRNLAWATAQSPVRHAAALAELHAAASVITAAFAPYDAVLMPTTPQAAFPFGIPPPRNQPDFTLLANIAGLAATAFPMGLDEDGLPVSVQAVAADGEHCLAVAGMCARVPIL